jgi:transcriptional regulator with XRE-family HTH domain
MKFHEKLYQLRKEQKMSQEDLAGIIGVSRQAVQKWEAGTSSPDMNNLIEISNYFGLSLDSLIKDDQDIVISGEEDAAPRSDSMDPYLSFYQ